MPGSTRRRGPSTTRRARCEARDAEAELELEVFAEQVDYPRRRATETTMDELFDQWYAAASPGWAIDTVRHTHSVLKVHLRPRFGHLPVGKITTADIDGFYAELRARGGRDGRRCRTAPFAGSTRCCTGHSCRQ